MMLETARSTLPRRWTRRPGRPLLAASATFAGTVTASGIIASGTVTAEHFDLTQGGDIRLRPGAFFDFAEYAWYNTSDALMASLRMAGSGSTAPLELVTNGSRNIDFAPDGDFRMGLEVGSLAADSTALTLAIGSGGSFGGNRTVKVDSGGYLYVA